jgi:hypothetical protein
LAEAKALSDKAGAAPEQLRVLLGLWVYYFVRADYRNSTELMATVSDMAAALQDPDVTLLRDGLTTCNCTAVGDFRKARLHGESAWSAYEPNQSAHLRAIFDMDMGASTGDWTSWSLWMLGYPDTALRLQQEVLAATQSHAEALHVGSGACAYRHRGSLSR